MIGNGLLLADVCALAEVSLVRGVAGVAVLLTASHDAGENHPPLRAASLTSLRLSMCRNGAELFEEDLINPFTYVLLKMREWNGGLFRMSACVTSRSLHGFGS